MMDINAFCGGVKDAYVGGVKPLEADNLNPNQVKYLLSINVLTQIDNLEKIKAVSLKRFQATDIRIPPCL